MSFLIRFPDQMDGPEAVGVKAQTIQRVADAGLPVPRWFVVSSEAFDTALSFEQSDTLLSAQTASRASAVVDELMLPPAIASQISEAMVRCGLDRDDVVLRVSLDPEDWPHLPPFPVAPARLSVRPADAPDRLLEQWRAAFAERVLIHRRTHGMHMLPRAPAVIVQQMLRPQAAGLAYGLDLVSGQRSVSVIASVFGLATSLTSGDCDADLFHVGADGKIVSKSIADKRQQHRPNIDSPGGVLTLPVPSVDREMPSLDDEQVLRVADLVRRVETVFERPQEIEWAFDGGKLYLLGARPIMGLDRLPDPDAPLTYWEMGNTAEFFPGSCSTLTFSFAREATSRLARSFCRRMGVSQRRIDRLGLTFDNLIGSFRGRIYGNAGNWYRLFSLLPDYPANARYYVRVSGLSKGLPAREEAALAPGWRDRWRLIGGFAAFLANWLSLGGDMDRFERRVKAALDAIGPSLERARADELASAYETLHRLFLADCDALALNDFYAMVSCALLRNVAERWCADTSGVLVNDLMMLREAAAVEESTAIVSVAQELSTAPELVAALQLGSTAAIRRHLADFPLLRSEVDRVVERYGDRAIGELRFEAVDFRTDPLPLYRALGRAASAEGTAPAPSRAAREIRERAEEFVIDSIGGRPVRNAVFHWLLNQVIERISDRVHLASLRRSLFGRIRAIMIELGRRYYALGLLDLPGDIVHLSIDEAIGAVGGGAPAGGLSSLVAIRKAEFEQFAAEPAPAAIFEARMPLATARLHASITPGDANARTGIGCCRGVARGRVRFASDEKGSEFAPGDILAVEGADPIWLLLYPSAGGLLVAFGGPLSQAVVSARAIGLPTVAGIDDLKSWLADGEIVEMNGETGLVSKA
ncbi:MAG: PEP/pyruvate-binding domain-containing protein [Capsulimonadaceae bacterium]|nr:PEP/pyruvate-binding domain-containing protein [Capsulimonadaceae bacterium]